MNRQREAATGCNREAAKIKQLHRHFTATMHRGKLEFIRLSAWLRMAWE